MNTNLGVPYSVTMRMYQSKNASPANNKPANPDDPTASLFAAPVKVAGPAFVLVGTMVGMLVDIIIIELVLIIMLELIIGMLEVIIGMLELIVMVLLVPEPTIAAAALYASSVLPDSGFSLITMAIPFWQCPACPQ